MVYGELAQTLRYSFPLTCLFCLPWPQIRNHVKRLEKKKKKSSDELLHLKINLKLL